MSTSNVNLIFDLKEINMLMPQPFFLTSKHTNLFSYCGTLLGKIFANCVPLAFSLEFYFEPQPFFKDW